MARGFICYPRWKPNKTENQPLKFGLNWAFIAREFLLLVIAWSL
jgi:hypothetical protein